MMSPREPGTPGRTGGDGEAFAAFVARVMKPEADRVMAQKRTSLVHALLAGFVAFAVTFVALYFASRPYLPSMSTYGISAWPILILLPATMAVIAASVTYLLSLRAAVKIFTDTVMGGLGEHIDPGIVHTSGRRISSAEMRESLLVGEEPAISSSGEHFRGRSGAATFEFCDTGFEARAPGAKDATRFSGLFFAAVLDKRFAAPLLSFPAHFPASLSAIADSLRAAGIPFGELVRTETDGLRQTISNADISDPLAASFPPSILDRICSEDTFQSASMSFSCLGNRFYAIASAPREVANRSGAIGGFDFGNSRNFCRWAALCLDMVDALSESR